MKKTPSPGQKISRRMKALNKRKVPQATGMAWYRPETYQQCLAIFADAKNLPATYEAWLVLAEETEQDLKSNGLDVQRIEIDPVEFPKWCAANGYANIDTHARIAFGNFKAMEYLRDKHGGK